MTDPAQAWILDELIRYLEHPASGALAFADMGQSWVTVRDSVRQRTLTRRRDEGLVDIASRWDQLLRYAALDLGSRTGVDVMQILPRSQYDPRARLHHLSDQLTESGTLDGVVRVPGTAGDLDIMADVRARELVIAMELRAPLDRGAVGRVSWLVNQLDDAPDALVIESYARGLRTSSAASLGVAREDRSAVLGDDRKDPAKFRLVARASMGLARKSGGRTSGFVDSVLDLVNGFYESVVQHVTPWTPPAPKVTTQVHRSDCSSALGRLRLAAGGGDDRSA